MKKLFLLVLMILGTGSINGAENQPNKPKPLPPHVKTAIRHHLYILGIVTAFCGYKFLLPMLWKTSKAKSNQESQPSSQNKIENKA